MEVCVKEFCFYLNGLHKSLTFEKFHFCRRECENIYEVSIFSL